MACSGTYDIANGQRIIYRNGISVANDVQVGGYQVCRERGNNIETDT